MLRSTITELEQDKELLKHKFNETHRLNLQLREKIDQLECLQQTSAAAMSLLFMQDMVQFCLGLLIKFTKLDRGAIFLLDDQGQNAFPAGGCRLRPRTGGAGQRLADLTV